MWVGFTLSCLLIYVFGEGPMIVLVVAFGFGVAISSALFAIDYIEGEEGD